MARSAGLVLLLVSFGSVRAHAQASETTGTIRVRVGSPTIVTSPVRIELKAADDPAFSRTGELLDARDTIQFPRLLPGAYRLTAALSGIRQAEAALYVAPATIAEIVITFCDPNSTCTASTTRVFHLDTLGHGYVFDRGNLDAFPGDDAAASVVETSVAQLIVDRISTGGLWVGEAPLIGGSGSSWRQTSVMFGGVDVTDPVRTGTPLMRSPREAFESLMVHTAMLPASVGGRVPS